MALAKCLFGQTIRQLSFAATLHLSRIQSEHPSWQFTVNPAQFIQFRSFATKKTDFNHPRIKH